ncbi:MAG: IS21 family transposase [Balneolaceae bacterium]|nr:MAG: IS21 family transposase [Balneolaceae bacterium]
MTGKDLNNWIMYHEIHQLSRLGFKKAKIAHFLVLDVRTVGKYLAMSEDDYEQLLSRSRQRNKKLSPYEGFVRDRLSKFQDTSAAQMHDWLKEHHENFPDITGRSVYNFVMFVRAEHNIPVLGIQRDYFPVEELPWGEQGQVDFGQYNMRTAGGGRKKVWFFVMVLSRSRMKYLWFSDCPFTSESVCWAHERAFAYVEGVPVIMVYDLDRIMVVDENMGEILLTAAFKAYVRSVGFKLHFCRKADPQSKGKVENVVGYIKKNFLYNRTYQDLQSLNEQALAWLHRTANHLPHNVTKQSPQSQHLIEKQYLNPHKPLPMENKPTCYYVRKNNVISYKSNFYSLPQGTYQGRGTQVLVKQTGQHIEVYSLDEELICACELATGKGNTVINTNHRRDTSTSLQVLIDQVTGRFSHPGQARLYVEAIRARLPRYTRDHVQCILKALDRVSIGQADEALAFCLAHELYSGGEFEQVLRVQTSQSQAPKRTDPLNLVHSDVAEKARQAPQTSNLDDYETIINASTANL